VGHDLSCMPDEASQELEFSRRELDLAAGAYDPMTNGVDLDTANA
jgi:hypothetical protein